MIASHINHVKAYAKGDMSLFLKRVNVTSRDVKDGSKRSTSSSKIVPMNEIVYIEGTVSVAF